MHRGNILERLDVKFFLLGGHQRLEGETASLGSLVIREPEYGSGSRAIQRNSSNDVKYIRITDFSDFGLPPGHEFVTAEVVDERYLLGNGDILFARSGATAGKTYIHSTDIGPAIFAGYCIRFQFATDRVLPEYVYFYTKTRRYQMWVQSIQRPSGQPNINKEEFKSFTLPVPSLPKQTTVVSEIKLALESRKQKLAQADELLSNLDGWLLEQFGFSPPLPINKKPFAVPHAVLKQQRLDPFFYTPEFLELTNQLQNSDQTIVTLGSQLDFPPMNGVDARDYRQSGQRYLRVQNVRPFEIDATDAPFVSSEHTKDAKLLTGDVLLTRKGTFGISAPVTEEYEGDLISSEIMLLRLSETAEFSNDYLISWLNSSVAKSLLNRYKTGGIMGHITQNVVTNFPVPVLSSEGQHAIVTEVNRRREEARRLRAEADAEWNAAKQRFESQLLGGE